MIEFGNDWDMLLQDELQKDYYKKLRHILAMNIKLRLSIPPCTTFLTH